MFPLLDGTLLLDRPRNLFVFFEFSHDRSLLDSLILTVVVLLGPSFRLFFLAL